MKIGLLVCDQVRPELQAEFGDYPEMFARLFPDNEMVFYAAFKGQLPEDVNECEVYMATGSSHSVYEDLDWIHQTKAFIRTLAAANKYFIGFCFGHQLMAEALGGKVEKVSNGWCIGVQEFQVHTIKNWMRPAKTVFNILMMCQDQVIELPPNAVCLAGREDCPNGMLQIGERIMSVQGHPEFSKNYDKALIEARVERIGKKRVMEGLASLDLPLDIPTFQLWVKAFLKGANGQ